MPDDLPDDRIVDLLDDALTTLRDGRPLSPDLGGDAPQVTTEVQTLLPVLRTLVAAAAEWRSAALPGPAATVAHVTPPGRIGRYVVRGRVGAGGMGEVYRADDPQLGRAVAVKVPRLDPARPDLAERFLREARAAAAVRHPNVCPIYDVGEDAGAPFVVMAFVPGGSLADRVRRGRFEDCRQAVVVARQVADALAAVHAHGIVHRDLKPANVLLDADGNALLTDFGLARSLSGDERLTAAGAILGTPAYMAPEQARGEPDTGPGGDVYSLGVVLYEMLTGRLPFDAPSVPGLLHRIAHDLPTPATRHRPDLDLALEAVLDRALAKRPGDRFGTARAFATALDGWLAKPGVAATSATAEPKPRPGRRRLHQAAFSGGLVLALGGPVALWAAGLFGPAQRADESLRTGVVEPLPALDAELAVTVSSDPDAGPVTKRHVPVGEDAAVPVRDGELVRVRARLSRPAHAFLLWIDSHGKVQPAFPWDIGDSPDGWAAPWVPGGDQPQQEIAVPADPRRGLEIEGPPGPETVVLLARSTPLPAGTDLAALTDGLPAAPFGDLGEVSWLGGGPGQTPGRDFPSRHRGVKQGQARVIDAPLFTLLEERLRPHFEVVKAVSFPHAP